MSDSQKKSDDDDFIIVEEMSPKDWAQVTELAIQILKSGQVGEDQLKATIYGFVQWIAHKQKSIGFYEDTSGVLH